MLPGFQTELLCRVFDDIITGIPREQNREEEKNIKKSLKIIEATELALAEGKCVFTVDGKMVDKPIIERAYHVINLAKAAGINLKELN